MPRVAPDLLTAAAERYGAGPALVHEGRVVTYADLEEASNRMAHSMIGRGVVRGDRVALWLPKSPEAVVALWGVMKAGAAYVPIDPAAPVSRAVSIARHCEVSAIVTQAHRAPDLDRAFAGRAPIRAAWSVDSVSDAPPIAGARVAPWSELESESARRPDVAIDEEDLAQIVFSSGSSGEPKGVMVAHRGLIAWTDRVENLFQFSQTDRMPGHAPLHSGYSSTELLAASRAGAVVYQFSQSATAFPAAVVREWRKQRFTVCHVVPSVLILMLTRGNLAADDLASMRLFVYGGEVFPAKHLRQLMTLAPQARFIQVLGRTETKTSISYELPSPPADDAKVPLGKACSGCTLLVLDEAERPVAAGEVGELWIASRSLMLGYWRRPDLTRELLKMVETSSGVSVLACRTGDLVRTREDGNVEFVGRRDHQIKTRGYRVELGEIESALNCHPEVEQAVALAIPDDEIGHRLTAVVVARRGATVEEAELKRHCASLLPPYMIPEAIELHSHLPLGSNGKVDRPALLGRLRHPVKST